MKPQRSPLGLLLALAWIAALAPACGRGGGGGGDGGPPGTPPPPADGALNPLAYAVLDVEYSPALDRLILVSASPHRLHKYDPTSGTGTQLALPRAPGCVSIAPDGLHAAVGYDGLITLVDLAAMTVTATFPVTCDVFDVILAANGFVYAFPRRNQWSTIRSIDTASGVETQSAPSSIYAGTKSKLLPASTFLMGVTNGLGPASLEKYSIASGTATWSASANSNPTGGDLWITSNGQKIFTQPGTVFAPSLAYLGTLAGLTRVQSLDTALVAGKVLAVPAASFTPANEDGEVQFFDATTYARTNRWALPRFSNGSRSTQALGRWLFVRAGETRFSVVVQASSSLGMASPWAVVDYPMSWAGTALAAPGEIKVTAFSTTATVSWAPVAGATGYSVYRATVPGVTAANYGSLPGGVKTTSASTSLFVSSLTAGLTYHFVVTATSATDESTESEEVSITAQSSLSLASPPSGLTATAGNAQVTLNWTPVSGATSFTAYAATATGVTPTKFQMSRTTGGAPFVFTGLSNAVDYFFCVTSSNAAGESTPGSEVTATPSAPGPPIASLVHKVVDAEYSAALNRIVMVATSPNTLYVFDPVGGGETSVALPAAPQCVSVGPTGLLAAVGYNTSVSLVDLGTPSVSNTWAVTVNVGDVVLAGNGFIYGFSGSGNWDQIHCLDTGTGAETLSTGQSLYGGTRARLQPGASAIYGGQRNISPPNMEKYSISGGTAAYAYAWPYFQDFPAGWDVWFTQNGGRVFSGWATYFSTSSVQAQDLLYRGSYPGLRQLQWMDHSAAAGRTVVVPATNTLTPAHYDTEVRFFEDVYYDFRQREILPSFVVGPSAYPAHGKYVFWNGAGTQCYVVVQADATSGLVNDFGVVTYIP
jgi:hypothetical protein